jgi:hypothetical protein
MLSRLCPALLLAQNGWLHTGQEAVLVAGVIKGEAGATNTLQVFKA